MKIKNRIKEFISNTTSFEAIVACDEALKKHAEYSYLNLSPSEFSKAENAISETLISSLSSNTEADVKNFVEIEKRIYEINNLGVKKVLEAVSNTDLSKHPSLMYLLERLKQMSQQPEWLVAESIIVNLSPYSFEPKLKTELDKLIANCDKYSEDIKIYKAVHEAQNTKSNFIISGLEKHIESYLNKRTSNNRATLLENLSKHSYDPSIKNLYNIIVESEKSFQLKGNINNVSIGKVYSPVIITESEEIFAVNDKAYVKLGNKVRPLVNEEYKKLPEYFTFLSSFLSQPNVEVSENKIKIFQKDKKIEILEEAEDLGIYINGKKTTVNEFHSVYLNSGIFRFEEKDVIAAVGRIVENWDSIFEIDFVKSIFPLDNPHRRADVFLLGEKTCINTVDLVMNETKFYNDCNTLQSRNLILEFANFDLGLTFNKFIVNEEAKVNKLNQDKQDIFNDIKFLEERVSKLNSIQDNSIRESSDVIDLIAAINEEIELLKTNYYKIQNDIKELETVTEGLGANVGDEVEYLKKKL